MMQLVNPLFLWALAGLSIPIGIHLLSRKEGKILRLGSLRHVHETSTQQFKGIRLNEILLLLLRCLLILLLTLILSDLALRRSGNSRWLLVEKGLERQPRVAVIVDSITQQRFEARLLAKGFPLLTDSISAVAADNYWTLAEELKEKNLAEAIVLSQNKVAAFNGLRASLPSNVRWISLPMPSRNYTLQTIQVSPDTLLKRTGHTSSSGTYFTNQVDLKPFETSESVAPGPTLTILFVAEEKYSYDLAILKASLEAIQKSVPVNMKVTEAVIKPNSTQNADWIFWLSDRPMPNLEGKLIFIEQSTGRELFDQKGRNRWSIPRLDEEVSLGENLTIKLAGLIVPHKEQLTTAYANDGRVLPDSITWSVKKMSSEALAAPQMESSSGVALILFVIVLFLERNIAYRRNQ